MMVILRLAVRRKHSSGNSNLVTYLLNNIIISIGQNIKMPRYIEYLTAKPKNINKTALAAKLTNPRKQTNLYFLSSYLCHQESVVIFCVKETLVRIWIKYLRV